MSIMPSITITSKKPFRTLQRRSSEAFLFPAKEVCFASVQVRQYPVILGDHPSCTSGPPVTLGWNYDTDSSLSCTVDEWEIGRNSTRRPREEIRVPSSVRMEWLLDAGFTPMQVSEAIQDVQKHQRRRQSSIEDSSLQEMASNVMECVKGRLNAMAVDSRKDSRTPKFGSDSDSSSSTRVKVWSLPRMPSQLVRRTSV